MPLEDIKRLRSARGQCKGAITRLEAYFNQDKDFDLSDIEVRESSLTSNYQKFQQIQLDILCQGGGEEDDETCIIEERYLALCSKLRKLKRAAEQEGQSGNSCVKQRVHLPPINIKPYDGKDISGYKQFMDLFSAVIDKDSKLSSVEKFYYLKSLLVAEPLQLIEGLPAALMWSKKYCDTNPNMNLKEVIGNFLEYIQFHKIPANVLMREVHPLGLVPYSIIMNALAYQADPASVDPGKLSPARIRRAGRSMSVQSSLDPYGSNTTLSSTGSSDGPSSDSRHN